MDNVEKSGVNVEKTPELDAKTTVVVSTPELDAKSAKLVANGKKLIEAKSISIQKRRKDLIAENNINELDLPKLLIKEDQEFYLEKKQVYLDAYPDLQDDPFDMDDLHQLLMEQIFERILLRKKKTRPTTDIAKELENSFKRREAIKKNLSVRRTDRVKNKKDAPKQQLNIAHLSLHYNEELNSGGLQERLDQLDAEEAELRNIEGAVDD